MSAPRTLPVRCRGSLASFALAAAGAGVIALAGCAGDAPRSGSGDRTAGGVAGGGAGTATLAARRTQRCDAPDVSLLVDSAGIGPVLLGDPVSSLASRCTVADTMMRMAEGMLERAHLVSVGGRQVTALSTGTADSSIIRVITTDPAFRTAGGVGVGSSVESLRAAHGRICAAQGEGNFVVIAADLQGVSFAIDWSPPPGRDIGSASPFPGGDPGTALDAARIERIWVHGVAGGCRIGVA